MSGGLLAKTLLLSICLTRHVLSTLHSHLISIQILGVITSIWQIRKRGLGDMPKPEGLCLVDPGFEASQFARVAHCLNPGIVLPG